MNFKELDTLLPSAAKRKIYDYIFSQLKSARLGWYADPVYRFEDVLHDFRSASDWVRGELDTQFEAAEKAYEKQYPKDWSNEEQVAFRVIDGERKYAAR